MVDVVLYSFAVTHPTQSFIRNWVNKMKYYHALSPVLIGISIVLVQSQVAVGLSASEVEKIAREITVQIVDSQNPSFAGSGIIIKQTGNTYTVLTARHVAKEGKKQIITPDKQTYQINNIKPLSGLDLAVVEFNSIKTYSVAKIGDSEKATASTTVYLTGFPAKTAVISNPYFSFNKGQVNANGAAQRDGYNLIYDNKTLIGMSGGAVLNEQGELVGIHGRADVQEVGLGTTIYSALQQMLAVGVDVGVRPPGVVAAAPKADDFYIKANEKILQNDYKGAIADLNQAIRLNPNYANAYNDRGAARAQLGDKQSAIVDYNTAIKINPNYSSAYSNRGGARYELGDKQGAIADYNTAIKINPNYATPYNNRGFVRRDLGDKQGAIADYNKAIQINPNYVEPYNNRGFARRELGDKQGAIADYNTAIKINPNYANAYNNRGFARYELGDKQGAIADYNKAIQIDPNYASAYRNRGNARNDLGDKQGAIADLQKAADLFRQQGKTADYRTTVGGD
jgi:tetratricopeptide (TPR) repeat protein